MKLNFAEPSGGLRIPVGSGSVSPGRVGGARGLIYTQPINLQKGGKVGSASKRADGCAQRGKTRGKMV